MKNVNLTELDKKEQRLSQALISMGDIAVAMSGGVDSTYLLMYAKKALDNSGRRLIAVTADAPNFAPDDLADAADICRQCNIEQRVITLGNYFNVLPDDAQETRCYNCKKYVFGKILESLNENPPAFTLMDGTNADDVNDYRPGRRALKELGIASPLEEYGFTKDEIRAGLERLCADFHMETGIREKPAFACLASRIPYGDEITEKKLRAIHESEAVLKSMGFTQVRVRCHENVARIEVLPEERAGLLKESVMTELSRKIKACGFDYAALDLEGYKMGNLNAALK